MKNVTDDQIVVEEPVEVAVEVEETPSEVDQPVEVVYEDEVTGELSVDEAITGLGTSVIRTFIPALVGAVAAVVVGWAASQGWDVQADQVATYVTPFTIAGYYAGVRWLEVNVSPAFGKLLGKATAPVYPAS